MADNESQDPARGTEDPADAGIDAAPEGASEQARPEADDGEGQAKESERALHDEGAIDDPDPDQPDPESGPASGAP